MYEVIIDAIEAGLIIGLVKNEQDDNSKWH